MIQNKFLIDNISSTHYEKLIYKSKDDIKNNCSRFIKNVKVAFARFAFAIFHREIVSHRSMAKHIIRHLKTTDISKIDSDQLADIKNLFQLANTHVSNSTDQAKLLAKFNLHFPKTDVTESQSSSSHHTPQSKPSTVSAKSNQGSSTEHSSSSSTLGVSSTVTVQSKFLDATIPDDILEKIESFLANPNVSTKLDAEDQGLVFRIAAEKKIPLSNEHLKYLRHADTFYLSNHTSPDQIKEIFKTCKKIKLIVIDSPGSKNWQSNMNYLIELNGSHKFLFHFQKQASLQEIFLAIEDNARHLFDHLDTEGRQNFIKKGLTNKGYFHFRGGDCVAEIFSQIDIIELLEAIKDIPEDKEIFLPRLLSLTNAHTSSSKLAAILDAESLGIVDSIIEKKMEEEIGHKPSPELLSLLVYQFQRYSKEDMGAWPRLFANTLNYLEYTEHRTPFVQSLAPALQDEESVKAFYAGVNLGIITKGPLVKTLLSQILSNSPDLISVAFNEFFKNFETLNYQYTLGVLESLLPYINTEQKLTSILKAIPVPHDFPNQRRLINMLAQGAKYNNFGTWEYYKVPLDKAIIKQTVLSNGGLFADHYSYITDVNFIANLIPEFTKKTIEFLPRCQNKEELNDLLEIEMPPYIPTNEYGRFFDEMLDNCLPKDFNTIYKFLMTAGYHTDLKRFVKRVAQEGFKYF